MKVISIAIRHAEKHDSSTLLQMPSYSRECVVFPLKEDILVAETNGKVVGAVSIGHKDIKYVSGKITAGNLSFSEDGGIEMQRVSGPWISKLFVLPEYRSQGIGKRLVRESVKFLRDEGFSEAYAGIYIKNAFREISLQVFRYNGFKETGSCICPLPKGYCQGTMLKKTIKSSGPIASTSAQTSLEDEKLADEITALGLSMGAELVGFTSAEKLEKGAPKGHRPSDLMSNARSIIILACGRKLNEDRNYFYRWGPDFSLTYIRLKDEVKTSRMEARQCIEAVKNFLTEKGFKVVTEPHGWSGVISFKMTAYSAGLGVFGKGGFLIHPLLGPLNVLACILTDAPLTYGTPLEIDLCKDCIECVKACKYGAIKKDNDVFLWLGEKCRSYDLIMNPVTLKWTYGPCNSKCVFACPIGKQC